MACAAEQGCECITFRGSDGRCWLKHKRGGESGPSPNDALISMNMRCDRSPVDSSCFMDETDFWGADIRSDLSSGLEECALRCRDTEGCESFTMRKSDNNCWLKHKRGGASGPGPVAGLQSMNIDCRSAEYYDNSDRSCNMEGWDFWGADIRDFDSSGYDYCRTACLNAEDCVSMTMRLSDNHCWLKSKQGGQLGPAPVAGLLSTNMECDTNIDTSCRRENTDFWGADLRNFRAADFNSCALACKMSQDCQSITFRPSDNTCWLKHTREGAHGASDNNTVVSMNVDC